MIIISIDSLKISVVQLNIHESPKLIKSDNN